MKKLLLSTSIAVILMGATQAVYAVALKPPSLDKPQKGDTFPLKKEIAFSWLKTTNATQYRLIISSSSNFNNYKPAGNGQCLDKTSTTKKCFVTTTKSTSFKLPKNHEFLKAKGNYYWQVQAVSTNSGNNSVVYLGSNAAKSGEFRQFSVNDAPPNFINESVLATPNFAAVGSAITFSVSLTTELPDGYAVNIEIDGDVKKMKGSGVDYSYTTTFDTEGEDKNFSVSIADATGNVIATNGDTFTITAADSTPVIIESPPIVKPPVVMTPVAVSVPTINKITVSPASIVQGDSLTFSTTLSDVLPSGYSVKVDYGNGLFLMNGSGKSYSFNAAPSVSAAYSIGVYDAKNVLSNKQTGNFSVSAKPAPVVVAPPVVVPPVVTKTTGYTKIANNGTVLSDSATLGSGSTDWACTKDNKTGLIWEVKTTDGGLRDWNNSYTWYKPEGDNGGFAGYQNYGLCKGSDCDTYAYKNAVNAQGLCGKNDWRMPTIDELKGLLTTTSTINQPLNKKLYMDATYFPNTKIYRFWSSSPSASVSDYAWLVSFDGGYSVSNYKYVNYFVRLVRR